MNLEPSDLIKEQLDDFLAKLPPVSAFQRPVRGWVRAIRSGLGISGVQLARSMGVQPPRIVEMEKGELDGAITLKTLNRVAEAMGCTLAYALIPKAGSLRATLVGSAVEGLSLSPEEIAALRLPHITTRSELQRWEQEGIRHAEAWASARNPKDTLSGKFMLQLHREAFGKVWKEAGKFRAAGPGQGASAGGMESKVQSLCENAKYWHSTGTYSGDEAGVRFYHRLMAIRPFVNGSEPMARMMTDLVLKRMYRLLGYTWGSKSRISDHDLKERYNQAMRAAEGRNFAPLLALARS